MSWLAFSKKYRHCNVIMFDGEFWIYGELNGDGISTRVVKVKHAARFVKLLKTIKNVTAVITVWIDKKKNILWKPYFVRSCNEVSRWLTGVDTGLCFNPKHFYNRLKKLNGKRNYEIISEWSA